MTNYEKIKQLLEMNVYEGVEIEYKYDWNKWWSIIIRKARDFFKTTMDEVNITSITPIPRVPKLLPVGTKVRVFEEWLDKLQEWTTRLKKDTTYEILEICDIDYRYCIWYNKRHWEQVPVRSVYPVWEE